MNRQKKGVKNFFFVFAAIVSVFVFFAACVITFLEIYAYRDRAGEAAASAASHAASSGVPPSSGEASSAPSSGAASSGDSSALDLPAEASLPGGDLLLVNYDHRLPDNFKPDLVTAYGLQMDRRVAEAYQKMATAAASDGVSLWVSSAYRSSERQEELFEQEVEGYAESYSSPDEAEAYAEQSVAKPGYSEHATGLALDLNGVRDDFDTTEAFSWLDAHAQDYGFILRYPKDKQDVTKIKYEPWHYRYVGVENAKLMKEKGLCLEEYLDLLQKNGSVN